MQVIMEPLYSTYRQAVKLFQKYISNDAPFCVNISARCRNNLYTMFDYSAVRHGFVNPRNETAHLRETLEEADLYHIFNKPRREVWQVMQDSYRRFGMTDVFAVWEKTVS